MATVSISTVTGQSIHNHIEVENAENGKNIGTEELGLVALHPELSCHDTASLIFSRVTLYTAGQLAHSPAT